jgi:DNA-binding transcriptional LysR family regulator
VELSLRELTTAQQLAALHRGEVDVGLVRTPAPDARVSAAVLAEEQFVVALPDWHRLAASRRVALKDLAPDPFILYPRALATGLYDRVVSACQQAGFSPNVVQETTQVPVMVGLVAAGMGVAVMPECVQALRWRRVVYRPLRPPAPATNITLVWLTDRCSPAADAFVMQATGARSRSL